MPAWEEEYRSFRRRDLSAEDHMYIWADGVHFRVRLKDDRLCTLVLLGVRRDEAPGPPGAGAGHR